ncbi:hypothetical protein ANRL2_03224 [Anaerolineae bacterium]|uniref:hypothetical protein n=1 Tax=Geobacter sp. TaxID=46610 RepID=UPI001ACE36A3|nr:hypothetical protein [Geobacter sp.]CAG0991420.1 hypothetical protein ANRL2_03224 [Anaerolineae bacterium]
MNEVERLVAMIETDESNIGVLSCGEAIAAALLFNRLEWLPTAYKHPLDAIDRLGPTWLRMVMAYHRSHS